MDALKMISNGRFVVLGTDGSFYPFGTMPKGVEIEYNEAKLDSMIAKYPAVTFIRSEISCQFTRFGVVA